MDPQKFGPLGGFIVTLKNISQHSCHLCSPALSWLVVFCRDIVYCLLLELCCDRVLLKFSFNCRDMSVLCLNIKTLLLLKNVST